MFSYSIECKPSTKNGLINFKYEVTVFITKKTGSNTKN